jgi:mono/diheme cytochrome c family protein
MRYASALLIIILTLTLGARAQEMKDDIAAGEKLARDVCAVCHIVSDRNEQPPLEKAHAPPLFVVAQRPNMSPVLLRDFLKRPHGVMREFVFTPEDLENLVSYIISLQPISQSPG